LLSSSNFFARDFSHPYEEMMIHTFMLFVFYIGLFLCMQEDPTARRWLQQLLHNIGVNRVPALQGGGGFDHMMVS